MIELLELLDDGSEINLKYFGTLNRSGTDKTTFITVIDHMILAHGLRSNVDIWMLNNETEIKKRTKKRLKKLKREREENVTEETTDAISEEVILQDRIKNNHMNPISFNSGGKLRGLDIIKTKPSEYKAIAQHSSNQIQVHQCMLLVL